MRDHWDGNYLRVRGEYTSFNMVHALVLELPPRARRIHGRISMEKPKNGTTSACAENTGIVGPVNDRPRNYLRVRGEYDWDVDLAGFREELPPRARRIRYHSHCGAHHAGTTSACAENTKDFLAGWGKA